MAKHRKKRGSKALPKKQEEKKKLFWKDVVGIKKYPRLEVTPSWIIAVIGGSSAMVSLVLGPLLSKISEPLWEASITRKVWMVGDLAIIGLVLVLALIFVIHSATSVVCGRELFKRHIME